MPTPPINIVKVVKVVEVVELLKIIEASAPSNDQTCLSIFN